MGTQAQSRGAQNPWFGRRTADGSPTLLHLGLDEACHSDVGAWTEAREVYVRATRLRERVEAGELSRCRILDVGTGLGWNLTAALHALAGSGCPVDVVALESDPRVFEAAAELARDMDVPTGLRDAVDLWRRTLSVLIDAAANPGASVPVSAGAGRLRLLVGDGARCLPALCRAQPDLAFDAVFLDPFSPKIAPALWEHAFLDVLARCMAPSSILATYSAASRVRLGFALAGLEVGRGPGIGNKSESTVASPDQSLPPLPPRAARNLERALVEHAAKSAHDRRVAGGGGVEGA